MDMYHVKWTRLQAEIFRLLCIRAGIRFNLRELARTLKRSPTAVSSALQDLEKEGLVRIKKTDNINLLSIDFNRGSQNAIDLKKVENLKMVYESGLSKFLSDSLPGCTIILFGSYSTGYDICNDENEGHKSDIDVAVIGTKGKDINLTRFDKILERTVIINFYTSFKEIHKHLRDSILNGILLSGSVDL
ncbi:MAG: helix-turn-helix domain-containing protein [Nanoarchaeota archaeon]